MAERSNIPTKMLSSGFSLPVLGIGTFGLGGEDEPDFANDEESTTAIRSALDLGYSHIDTAEAYGASHTEELVGKAIRGYDRKRIFITTKVSQANLQHDALLKSAKMSIKRMGIDYIDLYLIHAFNPDISLQETMRALDELVDAKLVRNIGACNFTKEQFAMAQSFSRHKLVANQIKLNLWAKTKPDMDAIEYCQNNDIMIIAYKIFGRGKISDDNPLLDVLSNKYERTKAQVVLNWILSKKNVVAIFTATNSRHLEENRDALNFNMDEQDYALLDSSVRVQ